MCEKPLSISLDIYLMQSIFPSKPWRTIWSKFRTMLRRATPTPCSAVLFRRLSIGKVAYEEMFNHTSTEWAPWYVIPADHKWFTRLVVAGIIYAQLKALNLNYPKVSEAKHQELLQAKEMLESQK